ncbi:hypothetical protein BDV12DRAFT_209847 [Aspergillus spectabilis]
MALLYPQYEEPHKVVITHSTLAALRCCAVHLIPIGVSSTIISLNIRGTYLGADLMSPVRSETINLMLFQLAAKAHEITIVASLGVMVLQYVRHELLFGEGLPLGLLGSGLTFNNLEYFFQKEFYGGLRFMARRGNRPRKIAFILFVILAGLVGALVGPASAVLLVPKSRDWSAGGSEFFLNGKDSDFWPDDLSGDMSELNQLCFQDNSAIPGLCPGGGYHSLWAHWGTTNSSTFQTQNVPSYAKDLSGSRFHWPVSSASSLVPPLYALGDNQEAPNGRTSLVQPHAATVVMLQRLAEDWWKALRAQTGLEPNQVDDRTASAEFKNAISVSRCAAPERLRNSDTTVHFPSIAGRFDFVHSLPLDIDTLNATRTDNLRFRWVHLPPRFGAASIGAIFETPWEGTKTGEASRVVVGCTIQAGWVPATVYTDKYTFWTGWYPWNILFGDRTPAWFPASDDSTNGRVAFGDEWLNLLTPPIPTTTSEAGSWRPSTIESIFLNAGLGPSAGPLNKTRTNELQIWLRDENSTWEKVSLVEAIICSVVVDGLSRTGSHRVFNTSSIPTRQWPITNYNPLPDFASLVLQNKPALHRPPTTDPDAITTIHATMKISGFSLQTSLASFLAMSVHFTHMTMATVHIIYNSRPALEALSNTGGGIKRSRTYAQVAKIRVIRPSDSSDQGRIELLFDDPLDSRDRAPAQELNDMRDSLLRHPATWPKSHAREAIMRDEEVWGLSTDTVNSVSTARVQLNQPYI